MATSPKVKKCVIMVDSEVKKLTSTVDIQRVCGKMLYIEERDHTVKKRNEDGTERQPFFIQLSKAVLKIQRYNEMVIGGAPPRQIKLQGIMPPKPKEKTKRRRRTRRKQEPTI